VNLLDLMASFPPDMIAEAIRYYRNQSQQEEPLTERFARLELGCRKKT